MQEELKIYLLDNASHEVYDLMKKAFDIFDDIYPVDIHDKYLELIMSQDNDTESAINNGDVLTVVIDLTKFYLNRILEEHLIKVNEDISFSNLIIVVEALLDIQDYEDDETILNIINLDIDNEEKLAEILSLVSPLDQSEILLEIENVDTSLLERIKESVTEESIYIPDEVEVNEDKYLKEIKVFEKFIKTDSLISLSLMKANVKPGYLFSVYANMLGSDLEQLEANELARELVGISLISVDGISNPKATIAKHIENYVSDMRKITQIDIKVTELLNQFQNYKDQQNLEPRDI